MAELLIVLQLALAVAFAALAIRTVASWLQLPDRRHGNLALALGSLTLLILLAPLLGGTGPVAQLLTDVTLVLFLICGYGLIMFRHTFVPFRTSARRLLTFAIVLVGLLGVLTQIPSSLEAGHSPLQAAALVGIFAIWTYCVLEPIGRFWLAARGRPAVERARLRAISLGYLGLLAVVVTGTVATSLGEMLSVFVDLLALAIVPLLYVAFFPPAWIRRVWRQPEEDQLRRALHDLLLYSPDRVTLARRALGWAERLVGGDAGFVIDSDGSVLATRGVDRDAAEKLTEHGDFLREEMKGHAPWREGATVVVPLDLQHGRGAMLIISGRLTPLFGDDELERLRQYATSITAGLDRVTLSSRIAGLERAKSDFLNVASHELRGPMTVIKGYLTMLEAGALGDLAPQAQSVMPLLISKSDEVNWMIEQMIEASKLEEGRLALNKLQRDIVELTDLAIAGVKTQLIGHDLKVHQPPGPIEADVDPDRFQIVIRNLLTNAAKYSPTGTEISVEVSRNGRSACVSVTDCGVGISIEDQKNLFNRFSRIAATQHVQGTGLGLWLSREIARMHDGDLTVESVVGRGSTFTFTVPLAG